MSGIRLHPKYGVNPTMPVCFFCRKDTGEVALLGAGYKGEAPRRMVISREPCDWCRENMRKGIVLVEAVDGPGDPSPTGAYIVMKEDAVRRMLKEPLLSVVLKARLAFVDARTWTDTGLREACILYDEKGKGHA